MRIASLALLVVLCAAANPNPPKWPASVRVFDPADTDIEAVVNAAFAVNGGHDPANHGQWSSHRFAFLFKPGTYTAEVPVGYYTHIAGLGEHPDDVTFAGGKGVYCEEGDYVFSGGALSTFWRAAENFQSKSAMAWATGTGMLVRVARCLSLSLSLSPSSYTHGQWAVSQAAPLRRVHVQNNLILFEYQPPAQAVRCGRGHTGWGGMK